MTVIDAIIGRRSIRAYDTRPIEEEKLTRVLEAARLAPSANNQQMWKFIVVTDPVIKEKLAQAAYGQPSMLQAPAAIVACGLKPGIMTCGQPVDTVDLTIALSFLLLQAYEQGLGTCWLGYYDQVKVKAVLNIPENVSVVAVTPLGYPAEAPEPRPRKSLDEIVSYNGFE
jgi:nitroreductase